MRESEQVNAQCRPQVLVLTYSGATHLPNRNLLDDSAMTRDKNIMCIFRQNEFFSKVLIV